MTYDVKADVGGKLAQLGGRLIDSTARRFADEFFAKFAQLVGGAPAAVSAAAAPAATGKRLGWLKRWFGRRSKAEAGA